MGREYHNKRHVQRGRSNALSQLLVIVITFILGYLTAAVVDIQTVSHWVSAQVLAHTEVAKAVSAPQHPEQAVILPKPKFEFYTLLTNEKGANTQAPTSRSGTASSKPTAALVAQAANATSAATAAASLKSLIQKSAAVKSPVTAIQQPESTNSSTYLVQVASFRARKDAEHMKGLLTLKGFSVSVVSISDVTRGNWFRVVIGPYANRNLAQKAQIDLAKNERLHGMVAAE